MWNHPVDSGEIENSTTTGPAGPGHVSGVAREDDAWVVHGAAASVGGSHVCSCSEVHTEVAHVPRQNVCMVVIRQGDYDGLVRFCRSATQEWSFHNTVQISTLITNVTWRRLRYGDQAAVCVGLAAAHSGCQHKKKSSV